MKCFLLVFVLFAQPAFASNINYLNALKSSEKKLLFDAPVYDLETAVIGEGSVVVIVFWASWCSYCKSAMYELDGYLEMKEFKGLTIIGVSIDKTLADAQKFKGVKRLRFPNYYDLKNVFAKKISFEILPVTLVLYGKNKEKVLRIDGSSREKMKILSTKIFSVLKGKL